MISKPIRSNFEKQGCTITEDPQNITIDCHDFKITKAKALPWYIYLPFPSLTDLATQLKLPFPAKKTSVGFWETHSHWGKVRDLKISDEVFIDLSDDDLQKSNPQDSVLKRIEKLKSLQAHSDVKNIDVKKTVEENVNAIARKLALAAEDAFEKQVRSPIVCEPEVILSKKWLPARGTELRYNINIVCAVPNLSSDLQKKLTPFGEWDGIKTKQGFVRSIFPIKNEIYFNEIVLASDDYPNTPYINMILNKKILKDPDLVSKIRKFAKQTK